MNKREMNKKGAEMTIGTIIVIVLALVVLVILVYGFSTGWTNLWEKITAFGGGKANVQTVVQSCQLACTTNSQYDYCKTRNLIEADANGKAKVPKNVICKELEEGNYGLDACDISCTPAEKGTCTGTITSDCIAEKDMGSSECVKVIGCKWTDDTSNTDPNIGTCTLDNTISCSNYNDKGDICGSITGCRWTPTPSA